MVVSCNRKNIPCSAPKKGFTSWHCQGNYQNGRDPLPKSLEINMFFSVGVETPENTHTAFGISVPAFDKMGYCCVSAADEQADIPVMAREAILAIVEDIIINASHSVEDITDAGFRTYAAQPDYAHCDSWFMIDIDLSVFEGKQRRVNITLPDILIRRIDSYIEGKRTIYKDRSHFLAVAARSELSDNSKPHVQVDKDQ